VESLASIGPGWRGRVSAVVFFVVAVFLAGVTASSLADPSNTRGDGTAGVVFFVSFVVVLVVACGAGGTLLAVAIWRCRAELFADRLEIRNWLRSARVIPLERIETAYIETRRNGENTPRLLFVVVDSQALKVVATQSGKARATFAAALSDAVAEARQSRTAAY
jgi:hypothetical protein